MTQYKVIDPKGIPHDGRTLEKGETFQEQPHSARVRAWLRFGQIAEVKAKAETTESDAKTKAEKEKAEAEAKAKAEADAKGGK